MTENIALSIESVHKTFKGAQRPALVHISTTIKYGRVTGIVGPDGAGKTTFLRLLAGLLEPTSGVIRIMNRKPTDPAVKKIRSYMPQKFGLYEDLTVLDNLNLYADLRHVTGQEKKKRVDYLLEFTGLRPFVHRLAGKLSGGMKQKLGLACALLHKPRILLLDEPSVGVDPISRKELWSMVYELVQEGIAVLWSTAYMDEAERCAEVLVLNEGRLLYKGPPKDLTARIQEQTFLFSVPDTERRAFATRALQDSDVLDAVLQGAHVRLLMRKSQGYPHVTNRSYSVREVQPRFEDAFMHLLGGIPKERIRKALMTSRALPTSTQEEDEPVVEAYDLTKRFGAFTAVDRVSFTVHRGEVFGLLGPNGAGKSTTFKMLCGLLKPTSGVARVAQIDLTFSRARVREKIGYMAQKFSLYPDLTVKQNLVFFGGLYGLKGAKLRHTVEKMIEDFELTQYVHTNAGELPLGFKQRLSMACAIMHEPSILFLDEPTSGVDPVTRREFWVRINTLVERGVAVIVTTHFMDEAEYCDRLALMYRGKIIALDTPDGIKASIQSPEHPEPTLEEAFITLIEQNFLLQEAV